MKKEDLCDCYVNWMLDHKWDVKAFENYLTYKEYADFQAEELAGRREFEKIYRKWNEVISDRLSKESNVEKDISPV